MALESILEPLIVLDIVLVQQATCGGSATRTSTPCVWSPSFFIFLHNFLIVWMKDHGLFEGTISGTRPRLNLDDWLLSNFDPIKILKVHVS